MKETDVMKKLSILFLMILFIMPTVFAQEKTADTKKDKKVNEYKKRKPDNPEIAIDTDYGTMKFELYRDVAPVTVDSMLARVREGFYDGLIFHRVIDGFMIQGGDPKGNGTGGPGYTLPAEFSKVKHVEGSLSMARSADPNSAGSQFFVCLAAAPHLDGKYTNFGMLEEGFDTLHKIGKVETDSRDKPVKDVFIRKMYVIGDKKSDK